jgi:hypothetical protein
LDVRIWGPEAWNFMHAVTFSYPKSNPTTEEQNNTRNFFKYVGNVLPCLTCRYHFALMLEQHPPDLQNRETLSKWLVDRHNDVNKRLNKPTLPYDFVIKKYEDMQNTCPSKESSCPAKESSCSAKEIPCDCTTTKNIKNAIIWSLVTFILLLFISITIFAITQLRK